jgi:uncharacterized protein YndB with AHSA1/START domain
MSTTSITIDAAPGDVFATLADGWTYSNWVVGTSHIRAVDAEWPVQGSRLYHAVGAWPLMTRDMTEVRSVSTDKQLVLLACGSRMGNALVTIDLEPENGGTRITMHEEPESGPALWLHTPLNAAVLARRNHESLMRLRATVERRTTPSE